MIEAILVVYSRPKPGRDEDFNDWYTNIHLRDALRFRGSIAAQRFKFSKTQPNADTFEWQYLALYDVFDAARFSREHYDNALTTRMAVTDAFDDSVLADYHYYPLQFRDNDPETPKKGGVILEQLTAAQGKEAAFRAWYEGEYMNAAMKRPGVQSGALLVYRTYGQIFPTVPEHHFVAIYRVADDKAAAAWGADGLLSGSALVDQTKTRATHWDKVNDRLTEDAIHHTSAAALAEEERARARMGNQVATGGREKLNAL
jgi:hypothetical protein